MHYAVSIVCFSDSLKIGQNLFDHRRPEYFTRHPPAIF